MPRGIILFGAMGVGDTTLGKEVAKRLKYTHVDLDDHHWRWDTQIPYTIFRSREERTESIIHAISEAPYFVMSGSMWSIRKTFEPLFELAVFMVAPPEIRAERIRTRSINRWGKRVLTGGDMYESNEIYRDYLASTKNYDDDICPQACMIQHEQWVKEFPCPVIRVDGTKAIADNAELVVNQYLAIISNHTVGSI